MGFCSVEQESFCEGIFGTPQLETALNYVSDMRIMGVAVLGVLIRLVLY